MILNEEENVFLWWGQNEAVLKYHFLFNIILEDCKTWSIPWEGYSCKEIVFPMQKYFFWVPFQKQESTVK